MENSIPSITRGPRESNIELLRIVAMFLVLVVHADFWSLGAPTSTELKDNFISSFTRIWFESISIICVNVFVFISGWFRIKPSVRGISSFLFQCFFFLFGIYTVLIIIGDVHLSIRGLAECLLFGKQNWFIKSYIGLYITAPILNIFIDKATKKQFFYCLVAFYAFQTIYGIYGSASFIEDGYSAFSFIGLYLLASYVRKHFTHFNFKGSGKLFLTCVLFNSLLALISISEKIPLPLFSYINPLVIIETLFLFLFFKNLKIRANNIINFISKSCFAVYLLHSNPNLSPIFKENCIRIYNEFDGFLYLFVIFLFLAGVYFVGIIIDLPRRLIWSYLKSIIERPSRMIFLKMN